MSQRSERSRHTRHSTPRAIVLAVQLPQQSDTDVAVSLSELEQLASGLGIRVVHTAIQKRATRTSPTLVGEGKLQELASLTGGAHVIAEMVLVDGELSPGQQRNLELALGVEVLDRTAVILRIFEQRAQTREARLEVEIARLQYETPRVRDDHAVDDREGGGGRGGKGHTNVELAKQRNRERLAELRRELAEVQVSAATRRMRRRDALRVALVGYTNAGKSSLMRALSGRDVLVEDKLFATLGTTVRSLSPETTPPILVSDTVGFIKNLPSELVASFRSTLDEAREAGLLLLVVDAADPEWREQLRVTRETLEGIGAAAIASRVLLNKIDRIGAETRAALARELPDALQLNAYAPEDIRRLREAVVTFFDGGMAGEVLVVPFSEGRLISEIRAHARVVEETYTSEGAVLRVRALPEVLDRWRSVLAAVRPGE